MFSLRVSFFEFCVAVVPVVELGTFTFLSCGEFFFSTGTSLDSAVGKGESAPLLSLFGIKDGNSLINF